MSTHTLASKTVHKKPVTQKKQAITKPIAAKNKTQQNTLVNKTKDTAKQVEKWVKMSRPQLDLVYKKAKAGKLPQGDTLGTAILAGGPLPRLFARAARILAWQGKVFDIFSPDFNSGVVVNKVSPVGLNLIVAKTYRSQSWMDGQDTIVIDYSATSLFARQIRDEIREVEPGLYLGKVWWGKTRILDFALETHKVCAR